MPRTSAAVLAALLAAASPIRAQEIDTLDLRAHTRVLAHDSLQGRGTGSAGERAAAAYIAGQLAALGIPGAAPDGGYLLPLTLRRGTVDHAATRLAIRGDSGSVTFASDIDFVPDLGGADAFRDFAGLALFAGTAKTAASALAGRELDGRVVVLLGDMGAEQERLIPDWVRREAEGVILLVPDPARFDAYRGHRGPHRLFLAEPVDEPRWQPAIPILVGGPRVARTLLAGRAIDPAALRGEHPFEALPLGVDVEAAIRMEVEDVPAHNVAGLLPGSDPERRDEVVAYTAHYDHLGVGEPVDGDSIYNGFSDNAAGVAMVLAIARTLAADPPARSVLFLFLTAEEVGLLGSTWYATHPAVPLDRTVALINLDAGAPPAPPRRWYLDGGKRSTLGELARDVAAEHGWEAVPSDGRANSDHWPFLRRGVPAVFLKPGSDWEGVSAARREELRRRWDRYHHPDDEWAPDFPFAGLHRYAAFALALGRAAADAQEPPRTLPPAEP